MSTNYEKAFAPRPGVYAAWQQLNGAVREHLDPRRYELVTLAAARALRSSYCALAHGEILAGIAGPETVIEGAGLDAADTAVVAFAEKVVADATSITEADHERLRAAGLSDEAILDVALAAAMRCFFSKTLDAMLVRPDARFAELDPALREALTVGRPIADA